MDNITCAGLICDMLDDKYVLELSADAVSALCKVRYETMCRHSKIGEYNCSVDIHFSPQSEVRSICVDLCLQPEIYDLIRKHGVWTVGSCCGHGVRDGFIQVSDMSVKKMLELGYTPIPVDEYGNGKNCFVPKTILRTFDTDGVATPPDNYIGEQPVSYGAPFDEPIEIGGISKNG